METLTPHGGKDAPARDRQALQALGLRETPSNSVDIPVPKVEHYDMAVREIERDERGEIIPLTSEEMIVRGLVSGVMNKKGASLRNLSEVVAAANGHVSEAGLPLQVELTEDSVRPHLVFSPKQD